MRTKQLIIRTYGKKTIFERLAEDLIKSFAPRQERWVTVGVPLPARRGEEQ